jgi:tetratricopeptide (TPR) repeat protein
MDWITAQMTHPRDLIDAGKYDEAIAGYRQLLANNPEDYAAVDGLARAFFGASRYRESIPLQWRMDKLERSEIPDHCGRGIQISCAHWCLGEQAEALRLMHAQCAGILNRSIGMAPDGGGGSTMGVLLHYMAVTLGDASEIAYSIKYLENLNNKYEKRPFDTPYPSHLVRFVLGLISLLALFEGATGESDLIDAITVSTAPNSLVKRRFLCAALFHAGVMRRKAGDELGAKEWFGRVFALDNPNFEEEWYLARFEVEGC